MRTTLAALPPAALDLLDTAAVLGEEMDADLLAAVTGRPPAEVHAGLDAAVRAGVLTACRTSRADAGSPTPWCATPSTPT